MMISLMKNMTRQMILNAFLLVIWVSKVSGYCAGLGANPGFRGPPIVEQVSMTSVQVSWSGLVTRSECADQYIVKSWLARNPNDYQMSDLLPTTQLSFIVTDLVPNQDYVFQAIAREDKGILGKEWNRSDKTYFRTTSYNPTVTPDSDGGDSSNRGNKYQSGGSTSVYICVQSPVQTRRWDGHWSFHSSRNRHRILACCFDCCWRGVEYYQAQQRQET